MCKEKFHQAKHCPNEEAKGGSKSRKGGVNGDKTKSKDWLLGIQIEFTPRDAPQHNHLAELEFAAIWPIEVCSV